MAMVDRPEHRGHRRQRPAHVSPAATDLQRQAPLRLRGAGRSRATLDGAGPRPPACQRDAGGDWCQAGHSQRSRRPAHCRAVGLAVAASPSVVAVNTASTTSQLAAARAVSSAPDNSAGPGACARASDLAGDANTTGGVPDLGRPCVRLHRRQRRAPPRPTRRASRSSPTDGRDRTRFAVTAGDFAAAHLAQIATAWRQRGRASDR
jgi:hypothetical protein